MNKVQRVLLIICLPLAIISLIQGSTNWPWDMREYVIPIHLISGFIVICILVWQWEMQKRQN